MEQGYELAFRPEWHIPSTASESTLENSSSGSHGMFKRKTYRRPVRLSHLRMAASPLEAKRARYPIVPDGGGPTKTAIEIMHECGRLAMVF